MLRRRFVGQLAGSVVGSRLSDIPAPASQSSTDAPWRGSFPALRQQVNGHPLTYLDSAATTLRPQQVIDAVATFYSTVNANPHGAGHTLARAASVAVENARALVASFLGTRDPLEVVFTRGTTEALNLVASTWGVANLRPGDQIAVSLAEHASNLLPWRNLAQNTGATLAYFDVTEEGWPNIDQFARLLTRRTRIVVLSQVSNVLGMINPVAEMSRLARASGRIVVVDGAQSAPHIPIDVHALECDFFAFSGHKMAGPMGIGVLWGRRELLDSMPPYQWGAQMAHDADLTSEHLAEGALKFGAGTPNASGVVGLGAAIAFLRSVGAAAMVEHERRVSQYLLDNLGDLPRLRLLGVRDPTQRVSVFTFLVPGLPAAELLRRLDSRGIAIRAGDLAALPLLRRFGASAAARVSCYLYTNRADIDRLAEAVDHALR